jgi:hypothetical protein
VLSVVATSPTTTPCFVAIVSATLLFAPLAVSAEDNPINDVATWSAIGMCLTRFGVQTAEQSASTVFALARRKYDLAPYQVDNLTKHPSFDNKAEQAVSAMGGCRAIVETYKDRSY